MPTLSALMSVYHATDAAELELTLNSLDAQTRPADEVVVVFDGEVSGAVRGVVAKQCVPEDADAFAVAGPELVPLDDAPRHARAAKFDDLIEHVLEVS